MNKKLWIAISLTFITAATGALVYANHQAELLIARQIDEANQQYIALAEQGDMPPVQLSYADLSANVLTSHYKVHDLTVSIQGMGTVVTVDLVDLKGLKLSGLPEQSSARIEGIHLASTVLQSLPAELADYLQKLKFGLNYQYHYDAHQNELNFAQQLKVEGKLALNYQFKLGGMASLWQYAAEVEKMTPQQQQEHAEQADYLPQLMKKVGQATFISAQVELANQQFWQELTAQTAAAGLSGDFVSQQQMLVNYLQQPSELPEAVRLPLLQFVQQPEDLRLKLHFEQPLSLASMQDGSAWAEFNTPEQWLEKSGFELEASTN